MAADLILLSRVAYRGQDITGPRLHSLLALLAADLRTGCGTARLVDGLWPDERPENPTKALQILVSRARGLLGSGAILTTPTGYRLALAEDQVDAAAILARAAASDRHARAGDHLAALAEAEAGLGLSPDIEDGDAVPDDPLSMLRAQRAATRRSLVRTRALALARLGRHAEAAAPLAGLVLALPRDEEVLLELLRCEAGTVGPAAALDRYDSYRRALRDDLGTDPGPALRAVHHELLAGTAPAVRHGVAEEPNSLLGRDGDIDAVTNLLRTSRVTSIVGPGGLGKTRLAQVVSRQAEQRVVHLVGLAGVTSDDDVVAEVASVLGVGEGRLSLGGYAAIPPDVVTGIAAALGPGPVLLVLDNCEHVIRGAAELVRSLVSVTRDLRVLTTSRAPLGLTSESVYPLPELSLPTAVELFGQRARAARPGADLPDDTVTEVCRHLDGLPLAVELAAARVRVMSVAEIAHRLRDRFGLLRGGARDAPERHRTLQAVVDWSWHLLAPAGQAAMRALSIFPGGFTAEAAGRVLGVDDALPIVEDLVDQSLLKVVETGSGTRLRMLETVREFSAARREEAGENDRVVDGFLAWAREFGVAWHGALFGADPYTSGGTVRGEQDNLVLALRHAVAREDGPTVAATTAVLGELWTAESNYPRLYALEDEAGWVLSHFRPAPDMVGVTRVAATVCAANTVMLQGPRATRCLAVLRRLPPPPPDTLIGAIAILLGAIGDILGPDSPALRALCDSQEPLVAAGANAAASYLWESAGDPDAALKAARRMFDGLDERASPWAQLLAHGRVGELSLQLDHGAEARWHFEAGLRLLGPWPDSIGFRWGVVVACMHIGDYDAAERWLAVATEERRGDEYGVISFDTGIRAEIRLARGDVEGGLALWRRAYDQLWEAAGSLYRIEPAGRDPWELEAHAVVVVAHAYHGRLDLVEQLAREVAPRLSTLLANPVDKPPPFFMDLPTCGALLLALAAMDLDRGARTGNARVVACGARLVALAERFRFLRGFQPTMSATRAHQAAAQADGPAYADAVSSYAGLSGDGLRAAAIAALRERDRI
ncbi:ATP-binding protein [Phytohabitans rumicis]|uniref:Bacterial transcriptional activator domain-containing protein n=1 Tax=Phytohabitans rumicis TaxID=1076125 RepID=A0A6V8LIE0_9ACTN|nr:BTAD domain-containing putative transcriptional regulator [Phytohabitans rumicis]GFJ95320.1 hypothetical protein Prum_089620 [Phytohabitans rumicis]